MFSLTLSIRHFFIFDYAAADGRRLSFIYFFWLASFIETLAISFHAFADVFIELFSSSCRQIRIRFHADD
jgi:hypothetical protein